MTAVGVPASVVVRFARDPAIRSVSNCTPQIASSVILLAVSLLRGLFLQLLISNDFEVMSRVLFATVGVPAGIVVGFTGDLSVWGVCNGTPESTSTVVLETLGLFVFHKISLLDSI